VTWGSWVRFPREEGVQSRHQHLFEENVKINQNVWSTNFKCERFGSCFFAREGISTPRVCRKGRHPLIKCAIS